MKKQVKILMTILMVVITLTTLIDVAFASEASLIQSIGQGGTSVETQGLQNFVKAIGSLVRILGVRVSEVVLLVLGIKYMVGSAEVIAEYKKTMVPYIVGAVLIFASTTLVGIVYDLANSLNNGGGSSSSSTSAIHGFGPSSSQGGIYGGPAAPGT